jgi:hypothetical protein
MRNDLSDRLGIEMTILFVESDVSVDVFIDWISQFREVFSVSETQFCAVIEGNIATFYFRHGEWYCKF